VISSVLFAVHATGESGPAGTAGEVGSVTWPANTCRASGPMLPTHWLSQVSGVFGDVDSVTASERVPPW